MAFDSELNWIYDYIERWIRDWCPEDLDRRRRWHLIHDALGTQILLYARLARKRPKSADSTRHQSALLQAATRMFTEALDTPDAPHMTHRASIFPFVAAIVLKLSNRVELVLRLAVRMAGEPGQPYVPTFVRDAGCQMLSMLWWVTHCYVD